MASAASFIGGEKNLSPHGKNLSPHGKFNDIDAKHKQKSEILSMRYTAYDNLFIF
jgi:hypothetical protein